MFHETGRELKGLSKALCLNSPNHCLFSSPFRLKTNNSFSSKTSSTNPRQAQRLTSSIPEEDSSDDDDDIVVTVKPNKPSTIITTTNTSVKAKSKRFGFF